MTALALSVLLALVSAVCYAAGAILQERVAATAPQQAYAPLRRGGWWGAVSLNGTGAVLHVLALAYGPLSVVQPLGALTIVFALPMAAVFVRREVGAAGWRGALLATAGLAGLLSLTGSAPAQALAEPEWIAVAAATAGSIAALAVAARWMRRPAVRSVLLAAAAGTAFGISSVFTKDVAVGWSWDSWAGDALPSLVMIALLAGAGVFLSQASYRGAGLAAPLAIATVVNPVVATVVGLTALGEQFRHGVVGTVLAVLAAVVASVGLALLASHGADEAAGRDGAGEAVGAPGPEGVERTGEAGPGAGAAGSGGAARPSPRGTAPALLPGVPAQPRVVHRARGAGTGPADIGGFPTGSGTVRPPDGSGAARPPAGETCAGPAGAEATGPWSGRVAARGGPGTGAVFLPSVVVLRPAVLGPAPRRTAAAGPVVRPAPAVPVPRGGVGRGTPIGRVRTQPGGRERSEGMLQPHG